MEQLKVKPHRHFCTYFDHRYLARGLALHASLSRVCENFTLWVLTLSQEADRFLRQADLANLRIVPLASLEDFDPELSETRATRSLVEFYFTCSPCLPRFLFENNADLLEVTYLDSDLFFFSDPEVLFEELADASVGLVPHRFSPTAAKSHAKFGHYNVGWLTFRRDEAGLACLNWWRERCLEWCFDRVDGERYADQKYLDSFEKLFSGVHSIRHPGANLAPWNLARHAVDLHQEQVTVDGEALVFFHFQGFRQLASRLYDSNLTGYDAHLTATTRRHIFVPYIVALRSAQSTVEKSSGVLPQDRIRRTAQGWAGLRFDAGRALRALRAAVAGNLIRA